MKWVALYLVVLALCLAFNYAINYRRKYADSEREGSQEERDRG
jgi:hypothetical protein